jgi:CRISPR system Cascade subunit CasC
MILLCLYQFRGRRISLIKLVQRARVSSQCWKRAVWEAAKEKLPTFFNGKRGRLFIEPMKNALSKEGYDEIKALDVAKEFGEYLAKYDADAEKRVVF